MKIRQSLLFATSVLGLLGLQAQADAQLLGTAETFALLGATEVKSAGLSLIKGDVGVAPGTALVGFPAGSVTGGSLHSNDAAAVQAQADAHSAYDLLTAETLSQDLSGQDLGGMTLLSGVYGFSSSAALTGTLTLDGKGDPNARFDFLIGSTLTTATASELLFINGADPCNVYWAVGSSATLGTATVFGGHILAVESVTLTARASIVEGSAIALGGAVTLDTNAVTACGQPVPEPASLAVLGLGLIAFARRRTR